MELLTHRCQFLVACLDLELATGVPGARWEKFQIEHLNDDSTFRITEKSRQIAFSWLVAAEAIANAVLHSESTIMVSINLDEAHEKVRYARAVYEALRVPTSVRPVPQLVTDNQSALELANGARIISHPSTAPRGKARAHVVLDEFAHVQHDRTIYTAALPVISKGGRLRMGSSPMGATGVFWEVARQELRQYPDYTRARVPWWQCRAFCSGEVGDDVESLSTAERVEKYGNERIKAIFRNMLLDDFQQEYECIYVDESVSYITWEMIRACQDSELVYWHVTDPDDAVEVAHNIKRKIAEGEVEPALVGGMDVGRTRNLTELVFLGIGATRPVRLMVSLDNVKFDVQERCARTLLDILPVETLLIDQNGIGMQLAENLATTTTNARGETFTNATKETWATEAKIQMERKRVSLPCDRDLAYQIHSIKKSVTAAKNNIYDTDRNEKHHADKFWALALALWASREYDDRPQWGSAPGWQRR
jgi:phage FluMu gp28-like protein